MFIDTHAPFEVAVEISQLFTWLGAALQQSPSKNGVRKCLINIDASIIASQATSLSINYTLSDMSNHQSSVKGQCWHNMVRSPVIVDGFPISPKPKLCLGLELRLNIAAELGGSSQVTKYGGNLVIKGFSTMLVATELIEDTLMWHYCFNVDGDRLSYNDYSERTDVDIDISELPQLRHVVGWCESCDYLAGKSRISTLSIPSILSEVYEPQILIN